MRTQQKFRQKWEFQNQKRLEKLLEVSQDQLLKQVLRTAQMASFFIYLSYVGSRWLIKSSTVLWSQPQDLDPKLQAAEQQRLKLSSQTQSWLR
jgi:hypothetical protein